MIDYELEDVHFHNYKVSHIHQGRDQDNQEDDKSDCPDVLIYHDCVGEVPQVISLILDPPHCPVLLSVRCHDLPPLEAVVSGLVLRHLSRHLAFHV